MTIAPTQVYLSYAVEDEKKAEELYDRLLQAGFKPWMFSRDVLPGESTTTSPQLALRQSDFFLAMLTPHNTQRKGIYESEYQIAHEVWKEHSGGVFIIPVRLEECKVPKVLRDFQAVDLFKEGGWENLLSALHSGGGAPLEPPKPPPNLVQACQEGRCVLYVGSGLSAPAGYPTWTQFLGQFLDWATQQEVVDARLSASLRRSIAAGDTRLSADSLVTRTINSGRGDQFYKFLDSTYLKPYSELPETHLEIPKIGFSALVTSNYDKLLEHALNTSDVYTSRDSEALLDKLSKREFFILKLFGQLGEPGSILAAPYQFDETLAKNRAFANFMESLFVSRSFLFVGASLDGILSLLDMIKLQQSTTQHYALAAVSGSAWETTAELLEMRYGVKVLPYPVSPSHLEVEDFFAQLVKLLRPRSQKRKAAGFPKTPSGRGQSSWLSGLQLTNIGPFESLDLELTPEWNILLGDNGVGKSSILRAIALGLVGVDAQPYAERLLRVGQPSGSIELRTNKGDNKGEKYITRLNRNSSGSVEVSQVPGRPLEIEGWLALGFPPVRTVSWQRPSGPQLETTGSRPTPDDLNPLLSGDADPRLDKMKQILINIDYQIKSSKTSDERKWGQRLRKDYFSVVRQLTGNLTVEYKGIDPDRRIILVTTDDGDVPIEMLSQGTISLLGWVGALVQRLYEVYDKSRRPLGEYALVLVDEIDAHMHPAWQQMLANGLSDLFPDVQFIATTHSPLIPVTLAPVQVIRLHRDAENRSQIQVERMEEDMRRWQANQVLTSSLFGLGSTMAPEMKQAMEDYTALVWRKELSVQEQRKLENAAALLRVRLPRAMESEEARLAFELIKDTLDEKIRNMPTEQAQKIVNEVRVQMLENVTGSRRPL